MEERDLKIIDEFINGFEPWRSEMAKKLSGADGRLLACFICGVDPKRVGELKDAVEKLRDSKLGVLKTI